MEAVYPIVLKKELKRIRARLGYRLRKWRAQDERSIDIICEDIVADLKKEGVDFTTDLSLPQNQELVKTLIIKVLRSFSNGATEEEINHRVMLVWIIGVLEILTERGEVEIKNRYRYGRKYYIIP
jgi:ribosomal protein S10